jgi:ubiquinone/menaquinone biosynthesis C-methylase UbiE
MHSQILRRSFIIALAFASFGITFCQERDTHEEEAAHLATLLNWKPGSVVAEIGAGEGQMTLAAARRVGADGKVYTTELDAKKLAHLQEIAANEKNITVLKAGETETNLPPECCDSIFMRLVYHHFTKPAEMDASLLRSLKPAGLLAMIDEDPIPGMPLPAGVPANRGGHGIPQKLLVDELTAAGFQVVTQIAPWADWPNHHHCYCVVFRKPAR